jgi:hypothetical protein
MKLLLMIFFRLVFAPLIYVCVTYLECIVFLATCRLFIGQEPAMSFHSLWLLVFAVQYFAVSKIIGGQEASEKRTVSTSVDGVTRS